MEAVKFYYSKPIEFFKSARIKVDGRYYVCDRQTASTTGKRMTMAAIFDQDAKTIRFGLAICHEQDRFVKKIGQELAIKSAREKPIMIITEYKGNFKDFLDLVREVGKMEEKRFLKKNYKNFVTGIIY